MKANHGMTTFSGLIFDPFFPKEEKIKIEDIGHALSLICRANGHCQHFYSVAQHSIYCAQEAKKRNYSTRVQLGALLHDASEAYISDITRPVKVRLKDYKTIEKDLQKMIYNVYGLEDLTSTERRSIQEIDDAMLAYEMKYLLNTKIEHEPALIGQYDLSYQAMEEVKREFILRANELSQLITK